MRGRKPKYDYVSLVERLLVSEQLTQDEVVSIAAGVSTENLKATNQYNNVLAATTAWLKRHQPALLQKVKMRRPRRKVVCFDNEQQTNQQHELQQQFS